MTADERNAFENVVDLLQNMQQRVLLFANIVEECVGAGAAVDMDGAELRAAIEESRSQAVDVASIISTARQVLE